MYQILEQLATVYIQILYLFVVYAFISSLFPMLSMLPAMYKNYHVVYAFLDAVYASSMHVVGCLHSSPRV
jgi:hypothetical protein